MRAWLLLLMMLGGGQMSTRDARTEGQEQAAAPEVSVAPDVGALPLGPEAMRALKETLDRGDYRSAQAMLLKRLGEVSRVDQRRPLLLSLGSIYFLSHDPLQAAVAWGKAAHEGELPEGIRFSLAMAYVQIRHEDWAMQQLTGLHSAAPGNALYPFWMGRIAYDGQRYDEAAGYFRVAIAADPKFSRAHDNLGLCLFDLNDVDGAMREHRRAIELQEGKPGASAWPYLNLGIAEEFRGRSQPAIEAFQHALVLDPSFAQAHYHLGNLYAAAGRLPEAVAELLLAAKDDPTWAEPHVALARIYRRLGDKAKAEEQVRLYEQVKERGSEANEVH